MNLRRYLNFFDNKKFPLLRTMYFSKASYTANQLASLTQLNRKTCIKYLENLYNEGIVNRDLYGNSYIYYMGKGYFATKVVSPLLEQEKELFNEIKQEMLAHLSRFCKAIIIYGSYARHEQTGDSDLDLCCVIERNSPELDDQMESLSTKYLETYSVILSPYVVTLKELKKKRKTELIQNILRDGDWVYGEKEGVFNKL